MARTTIVMAAALALAVTLPAVPAQALATRTFVSAAGSDSNNCTNVATPCRHFAAAYAATAPNGEIYVLDPANYGSLTITGPVSIEGHGWASIAPVSGSPAITINAPGATDNINIIGVVLDGTATANTTGIQFNSGGTLTVRDSVIRNFGRHGINFFPNASSNFFISNTLVSDNGANGILVLPTAGTVIGFLDNVAVDNNTNVGLYLDASSGATINATVRNSTITNSGVQGLTATAAGATVRLTRSTITGNGSGWGATSSAAVISYNDNNIDGNTSGNAIPPQIGYK